MTVQELIDKLQQLEDKTQQVYLSKDPEGNEFMPLSENPVSYNMLYDGDSMYGGDESAENNGFNDDEWERMKQKHPNLVTVLWP